MQLRTTITATAGNHYCGQWVYYRLRWSDYHRSRSPVGRQVARSPVLYHTKHIWPRQASLHILLNTTPSHPGAFISSMDGRSTTRVPYNARSNVQAEHKSLIFSSLEHFQALSRVERFPKGLPTTSLHFLQVSEAESQSITSCEPFHIAVAALAIISSCRPSMPHELCCHCSTV